MVTLYGLPSSYLFQSTDALPALLSLKTIGKELTMTKIRSKQFGIFVLLTFQNTFWPLKTQLNGQLS